MSNLRQIPLTGINGANPLGFLAALGAFRAAQQIHDSHVLLSWAPAAGTWQPILHTPLATTPESLIEGLNSYLSSQADSSVFTIAKNIKMPADRFRGYAISGVENWFSGVAPNWAAFAAAFSSDGVTDQNGEVEDTAFRTMSGAGHQHFLQFMNDVARATTPTQIKEALFGPWSYSDTQFSMRWDPEDDRRYSLRWSNPSTDPAKNVRGANRLAIEALPFFPTMPNASRLQTTGFVGKKSNDTFWIWPVWDTPISIDVCSSLLTSPLLVAPGLELAHLMPLGVAAVFRSKRVTIGKFRNFTPAIPAGG
jgi:hypothetical protein